MKIKDIKDSDRPMERLIKYGPSVLSDAEILAIIIGSGNKKQSAIELSSMILNEYSIKDLMDLNYKELFLFSGIKMSKATKILASFELARRSLIQNDKFINFNSPNNIYEYIKSDYIYSKNEMLYLILVDVKCRLIKKIKLSDSRVDSVSFDARDIITNLVRYNAYGYILIHNHPSGDLSPSKIDILTTKSIKENLEGLGFILIDHLIVGNEKYYSFLENNIL